MLFSATWCLCFMHVCHYVLVMHVSLVCTEKVSQEIYSTSQIQFCSSVSNIESAVLNKVSRVLFWILGINRYSYPITNLRSCFAASESDCGLIHEHRKQRRLICFASLAGLHTVCTYVFIFHLNKEGTEIITFSGLFNNREVSPLMLHG